MESRTFTYFIKVCLILTFAVIVYFVLLYMDILPKYSGKDDFVEMEENLNQTVQNEIVQNQVVENEVNENVVNNTVTNNTVVDDGIIMQEVPANNQTTQNNTINEGTTQEPNDPTQKNITQIPHNIIQINT